MDYEGYTFVFFIQKKNKQDFFSLKCDMYAFTFQP